MHARTGVARLALASDVPVVPVVHWGTREVYDGYQQAVPPAAAQADRRALRRAGRPHRLPRAGRSTPALLREVTDVIMGRVRDLLAEVRDEPAPSEFFRGAGA